MAIEWILLGGAIGSAATWLLTGASSPLGSGVRYRRTPVDRSVESTSLKAEVSVPFAALRKAFGPPDRHEGPDMYNEWFFKGPGGPFTIYDRDRDNAKGKGGAKNWHIGGRSDASAFLAWMRAEVAKAN